MGRELTKKVGVVAGWWIVAGSWTPQVEVDGQTLSRPQMADGKQCSDVDGAGARVREEARLSPGRFVAD